MMYRDVELKPFATVGDSGTETIDLNLTDPITALQVYFKVKNGASDVDDKCPEACITKLELVDGGRVLSSLSGKQAIAAAAYHLGRWPRTWYCEVAAANQRVQFPIPFGRYEGDPDFALDPTKLLNPQFKVTWAKDDDHATGEVQLGVIARVMADTAGPSKALLWKSVREFVPADSGVEVSDIPTDDPIRAFMLMVFDGDLTPTTIITHIKLDADLGKFIPFDLDIAEFDGLVQATCPLFTVSKYDAVSAGEYRACWLGRDTVALMSPNDSANLGSAWASGSLNYAVVGAALSDTPVQVAITGSLPHCAWRYLFGRPNEPATWFPAPSFRSLRLHLTQASATGTVGILVQSPVSV